MTVRPRPDRGTLLAAATTTPLDELDVTNWHLFEQDALWPYFERLRREDPVHYHSDSRYGPFWSITRFEDMKFVDLHNEWFSSEGSIALEDMPADFATPMFIAMDQPKHDVQRKAVSPVVAPRNLAALSGLIREPQEAPSGTGRTRRPPERPGPAARREGRPRR